jgi:hypothetical protein
MVTLSANHSDKPLAESIYGYNILMEAWISKSALKSFFTIAVAIAFVWILIYIKFFNPSKKKIIT